MGGGGGGSLAWDSARGGSARGGYGGGGYPSGRSLESGRGCSVPGGGGFEGGDGFEGGGFASEETLKELAAFKRRQWVVSSRRWVQESGRRALTRADRKAAQRRLYVTKPNVAPRVY